MSLFDFLNNKKKDDPALRFLFGGDNNIAKHVEQFANPQVEALDPADDVSMQFIKSDPEVNEGQPHILVKSPFRSLKSEPELLVKSAFQSLEEDTGVEQPPAIEQTIQESNSVLDDIKGFISPELQASEVPNIGNSGDKKSMQKAKDAFFTQEFIDSSILKHADPDERSRFSNFKFDPDDMAMLTAMHEGGYINRVFDDPGDKGNQLIGVGSNIDTPAARAKLAKHGIDLDQIRAGVPVPEDIIKELFVADILDHADIAKRVFKNFDKLDAVRQMVLTDMAFTLGEGGLNLLKTLKVAIDGGSHGGINSDGMDFNLAAKRMGAFKWARDVGSDRANRLIDAMRRGAVRKFTENDVQGITKANMKRLFGGI